MGFASAALWKFLPKDVEDRGSSQIGTGERAKSTQAPLLLKNETLFLKEPN